MRVVWILASDNGCVLAHGHPDPTMPQYHLDNVADRPPAIVSAPSKASLGDAKRAWNDRVRRSGTTGKVKGRLFVRERKVRYDLTEGMTYGDYEACVKIFACAVKAQCFKTKYQPRSFT